MNKSDLKVVAVLTAVAGGFLLVPGAFDAYRQVNVAHGYLLSFVKFALLATFGECLALRLTSGRYLRPGFGLVPKMLVWGVLGLIIKAAFVIFATGTPNVLASLGVPLSREVVGAGLSAEKILLAFSISLTMNVIFAPVLMTLHKITDTHIHQAGGTLRASLSGIDFAAILKQIDWAVMWNFVFKRTIPFFWIPAHTITFLLPAEFQIIFAALLGVTLGLILAFAANMRPPASRQLPVAH